MPRGQVFLRFFQGGFLHEPLDLEERGLECLARCGCRQGFPGMDVSVAGLRAGGLNSDGDDHLPSRCNVQGVGQHLTKTLLVVDDMVGRQHRHDRSRRTRPDHRRAQCDCGAGVATHGLANDIFFGQLRQLPPDFRRLNGVGDDENVGQRHQRSHPIHGLLQKGTLPQEADQLLGCLLTTHGPEPLASPTSHNDDKTVRRTSANDGRGRGCFPGHRPGCRGWRFFDVLQDLGDFGSRLRGLRLRALNRLCGTGRLLGGHWLHEFDVQPSNTRIHPDSKGFIRQLRVDRALTRVGSPPATPVRTRLPEAASGTRRSSPPWHGPRPA